MRHGHPVHRPDGSRTDDAAVQPFLSGAISKTVNLPESSTVEDIAGVYMEGWKLGLKALAVYRDNCKVGQPLSEAKKKEEEKKAEPEVRIEYRPRRQRLPKSRMGRTTSFQVAGAGGYLTTGAYDSGRLGEIFLKLGKQGSTLAGVMDAFSIAVSIGLQYGVPLESFAQKFSNLKFEPAGMTDDPDIRISSSIIDYVFRRLALDYLDFDERAELVSTPLPSVLATSRRGPTCLMRRMSLSTLRPSKTRRPTASGCMRTELTSPVFSQLRRRSSRSVKHTPVLSFSKSRSVVKLTPPCA
ncbi:ribonucleotide reductase [Cutibacterium acnes JCM 18920]|nr:ribonucleotide reductase [Cutibacterium acnes JCM 18920]